MNAESIRQLLRQQPFEPVEVHMTNGDVHPIRQPEQAFLARARLLIYYPESDRLVICSLLHVATITLKQSAAYNTRRLVNILPPGSAPCPRTWKVLDR